MPTLIDPGPRECHPGTTHHPTLPTPVKLDRAAGLFRLTISAPVRAPTRSFYHFDLIHCLKHVALVKYALNFKGQQQLMPLVFSTIRT